MKFIIFLVSALLAASAASATGGSRKELIVGGWQPIKNVSDPHVQEIAKFAVDEYNKYALITPLKLLKVTTGETQIVNGINYRLVLIAAGVITGTLDEYEATVWEKSGDQDSKELRAFRKLKS